MHKLILKILLFIFFIHFYLNVTGQLIQNYEILYQENIEIDLFEVTGILDNGLKKQIQNRIISIKIKDSNSSITIGLLNEELGIPFCESSIKGDTLKLIYGVKGLIDRGGVEIVEISEMPKYQEVLIQGLNLSKKPICVILNGKIIQQTEHKYKLFPIEFKVLNGDTVNLKDEFGQKQGHWFEEDESFDLKITRESNFKNSELISYKITEYFTNDIKRKIEYWPYYSLDSITCQWFYKTGELLDETYYTKNIGSKRRQIYYKNGNPNQEFFYREYVTETIGYHENGSLKYKGSKNHKSKYFTLNHQTPNSVIIKIKCETWNQKGNYTGMQDIEFYKYDLRNFQDWQLIKNK